MKSFFHAAPDYLPTFLGTVAEHVQKYKAKISWPDYPKPLSRWYMKDEGRSKTLPLLPCVSTAFMAKTLPFCLAFSLPSWLRQRLPFRPSDMHPTLIELESLDKMHKFDRSWVSMRVKDYQRERREITDRKMSVEDLDAFSGQPLAPIGLDAYVVSRTRADRGLGAISADFKDIADLDRHPAASSHIAVEMTERLIKDVAFYAEKVQKRSRNAHDFSAFPCRAAIQSRRAFSPFAGKQRGEDADADHAGRGRRGHGRRPDGFRCRRIGCAVRGADRSAAGAEETGPCDRLQGD